jgi:hypothetical protein
MTVDPSAVEDWIAGYERLWRTHGTDRLGELFTPEISYLPSPWAQAVSGLPALARFWEGERAGADEPFEMRSDLVAVDGNTAVVRVAVDYAATGSRWRDVWIIEFADDGRCRAFEEWPFAPDQKDGHED